MSVHKTDIYQKHILIVHVFIENPFQFRQEMFIFQSVILIILEQFLVWP